MRSYHFPENNDYWNALPIAKYRNTGVNKRYSKCGYPCSLKHLKSLYTFMLADNLATI